MIFHLSVSESLPVVALVLVVTIEKKHTKLRLEYIDDDPLIKNSLRSDRKEHNILLPEGELLVNVTHMIRSWILLPPAIVYILAVDLLLIATNWLFILQHFRCIELIFNTRSNT